MENALHKQTDDVRQALREKVIEMWLAYVPQTAIAERMNLTKSFVNMSIRRALANGEIIEERRRG